MKSTPYRQPVRRAGAAVLFILAIFQTSKAQPFDPSWRLHFDLAIVDPSGDAARTDVEGIGVQVGFDSGAGAGLRGEYRFSELLGVEIGALGTSSVDVKTGVFRNLVGTAIEVKSFTPFTVGLNVHLAQESPIDLFGGPFLAIVNYGNVNVETGIGGASTGTSIDSDLSWGAIVGIDVPVGKGGWSVHTNLRYIDTEISGTDSGVSFRGDLDPFIFSVGFGYRF